MSTVHRISFGDAEVFTCAVMAPAAADAWARSVLAALDGPLLPCLERDHAVVTIGAPLYRNDDRPEHYTARARATNHLLYECLHDLYETVAQFLQSRYLLPVVFAHDLAIPGFHLFTYERAGLLEGGGWHFDQLHSRLPALARLRDRIEGSVNFTLALAVPSGGTGMDLVDATPGQEGTGVSVTVPYAPGVMLFNENQYWHRIGNSVCRQARERRLTLQGHGVVLDGRLLLFW